MSFLDASALLGAVALVATALSIGRRGLRLRAVVAGSVGLIAGAAALLTYTLHHLGNGLDLDAIPHERGAQWFVAAFGLAALPAAASTLLPFVRRRLAARENGGLARRPSARVVRFPARPRTESEPRTRANERRDSS